MDLLNLIFRLGVLFAIYGFLWFFIELGLTFLRAGRQKTMGENYLIKSVKYLFLVNVTFLFCLDLNQNNVSFYNAMPSAIVLATYFIGKLQQQQQRLQLFGQLNAQIPQTNDFNLKTEIILIVASIGLFIGFLFFPQYASNNIANWFKSSILDIESTVIIGFIFKIIGFFFLLGMIMKMINAINYIISGKPVVDIKTNINSNSKKDEDKFDDFEEIN
ncbi:MAG: hypothetical protein FGM14_02970 [Flavobacteriales bacterium]|nr:hypothetical protein [Flavobacteriales bacterium]